MVWFPRICTSPGCPMSSPKSTRNSLCHRRITPWPTQRPASPAGGGVVVRALGNQRARHFGASSRRPPKPLRNDIGEADASTAAPLLFPLSSTSADELRRTAGRLADWVQAHDDVALPDLAYTLARRRAHRPVRTAVIAGSRDGADRRRCARSPTAMPRIRPRSGKTTAVRCGCSPGRVRSGRRMGADLLATEPVFAATVAQAEPLIAARVGILGDRGDDGAARW